MVVYEVNISIDKSRADEFRIWLKEHIAEVCRAGGFSKSAVYQMNDIRTDVESFCIQYFADSMETLDRYIEEHAPRLRKDGLERFGDHMEAERRILTEI